MGAKVTIYVEDVSDETTEYVVRETGDEFDNTYFDNPNDALDEAEAWQAHYMNEGIEAEVVKPGWL